MDAKHTPGPWEVSESNSLEVEAGKFDVAFCGPKKGLDIFQYDERMANARLIAAAPETAAERETLRLLVKRIQDALGTGEEGDNLVAVARDAHNAELELAARIRKEEQQ